MFQRGKRKRLARNLIAAFNAHDCAGVQACLAADCVFIDSSGARIDGRETCAETTRRFFEAEPGFHLAITSYTVVGEEVLMSGTTTARDPLVAKDRLWRAKIVQGEVAEFQSYCDGEPRLLARALAPEAYHY
ncbi:nuclear transport factor 2 family protein [Qipengyuania sp. XHP0207]|uniref:nuclear transport factor 2 family protein n=1 Tax=Qipengyuania sp. XHP0207 TaxID=3038078 RepID=UPI002420424E|nr:nuclear transport factor 2 family protein [Qipengyuania sp. XHP0207]MDG5747021.1 nuclear transport factor 2 family protein [Qipengyuania sp. XHP0207]